MRREWTAEEEDYLTSSVGVKKVGSIAHRLNRSVVSVEMKMKRMGLFNTKEHTGKLTMGSLANLLGADRNTVKNWGINHGLPYEIKKIKHTKSFYFIDPELFWIWAEQNKDKINFSAIERHSIPPEPDWVDPLRISKRDIRYRNWTTKEEGFLLNELKKRRSYTEIAKELNRSRISVERKSNRIIRELQV